VWVVRNLRRKARRGKLRAARTPPEWRRFLSEDVPLFNHLPPDLQEQLLGHVNVFLAEKRFEGCGGMEITEEVEVSIAGQACMLMLNKKNPTYYPRLITVLVYPGAYVPKTPDGSGRWVEDGVRLGESWNSGELVVAWDHVRRGAQDVKDGHNVVLHEFAHQLDQEDGAADGAPMLEQRSSYVAWGRVMHEEYDALCDKAKRRKRDVMSRYGATNPAEFFAVATETFFEKARKLREKHPELYEELKDYYQMDPAEWPRPKRK